MKTGWQIETLANACKMYQPKTISAKDMVGDGDYPVFGANGIIGRYNRFNHAEPQLLITCRGATCGSVNVSLPNSWITGNAMVVRPKDNSIDLRYLEYYFRGGIDISAAITGAAQPQITRANLEPLTVQFPSSLDEQRRIVAVLDKAFAGIATATANAQKNLANARAVLESYAEALIAKESCGDKRALLKSTTNRITNGYVGPTREIYVESGIPYLLARQVKNNTLKFDSRTFISHEFNEKISKSKLLEGDVLLVQSGHIGHSAVVPLEHQGHNCHAMIVITPKAILNGGFLSLFFNTAGMKRKFAEIRSGSTVPHLTCKLVRELMIPLPSISKQFEIVKKCSEVKTEALALESYYAQKLATLTELKQSLLQKAFAGELT